MAGIHYAAGAMKRLNPVVCSLAGVVGCDAPSREEADLVLMGAHVVTMNRAAPEAEAVAIQGDRILAVAVDDDIERHVGSGTTVFDLRGQTAVPGMIDSHVRFVGLGNRLLQLDATNVPNKDEILERVAAHAADAGPGACIRGRDWDLKGPIEPGKLADIVVLSKDILDIPVEEIPTTEVLMTILGGEVVHEKPAS